MSAETGLGSRVVKYFTQNLVGKHHHIFCDNFCTSVKLFTELHEVGVYATGTLKADRRGFPHDIKGSAKKRFKKEGECKIRRNRLDTNLSVCVWQDTKPVTACTTFCQTTPLSEVQCKIKSNEHHTFPCPETIETYNRYVGGVDKNDQFREYYHVQLKSRKYYKYTYFGCYLVSASPIP